VRNYSSSSYCKVLGFRHWTTCSWGHMRRSEFTRLLGGANRSLASLGARALNPMNAIRRNLDVYTSKIISTAMYCLAIVTLPTFTPSVLAQSVQTISTERFLQSPFASTADEPLEERLARPLSRNEEFALKPMDKFKECELCPEMVVIPAGQLLMGAKEGEPGSTPEERPQHKVNFAHPFSVGRFPVTFSEWDACVAAGGCSHQPADKGWGRGRQPVISILWDDAHEYVAWLFRATGRTYRLLSESEREYVTRATTTTAYWWGESFDPKQANCTQDKREVSSAASGGLQELAGTEQTLPVQSFGANPWGLYQVHGNVYDWVEDCWNANYDGAPSDGSAWISGNCRGHVLRGGAFSRKPNAARSAARTWFGSPNRMIYMSVRVARTLRR
jgi:formylglycine-generating enzyme required for sulfatase activity